MELDARKRRFLIAAYKTAPLKDARFKYLEVGKGAGFNEQETRDIVRELSQTNPSILMRLPNDEATLTNGRELARRYIEEEEQEKAAQRRQRWWTILKAIWSAFLAIVTLVVLPLLVNH